MAKGDGKAAVASAITTVRKQKGKKSTEDVEVYTTGDNLEQLERQTTVSKPGKSKTKLEQYVLSGDTLQTTKNGKQNIYIGPKASKRFARQFNNQ